MLYLLKKHNFDDSQYFDLSLCLGLLYITINAIKVQHKASPPNCLHECIAAWLKQVDKAEEKGGPTWYTLIDALRSIKQIAAADEIDKESKMSVFRLLLLVLL